uniref:DUF148 domain-containing protein n=1 Tax=Steinernema glaseri TaxID=37863 RepID=A0A1I7YMB8_9BILA
MFHIDFWLRFLVAVALVAIGPTQGVPTVARGSSSIPSASQGAPSAPSNSGSTDWGSPDSSWGNQWGSQNAPNPVLELLQSNRYQEFKKFDGYTVPETLTKKQAEQHLKEWISKQQVELKDRYQKDLNDIDKLFYNLTIIVNQVVTSFSKEVQSDVKQVQQLDANLSLTLRQMRDAKRKVLEEANATPQLQSELQKFGTEVVNGFIQRFGAPTVAGRPIFGGGDGNSGDTWGSISTGWGQNGNEGRGNPSEGWGNSGIAPWNQGSSGSGGWGQTNGNNGANQNGNQPSWGGSGTNGWGNPSQSGWGNQSGGQTSGWGNAGGAGGWGNPSGSSSGQGGWGASFDKGWSSARASIGQGVQPQK